ncbi:MAG: GNAT family N-acetyltransferase [Burkholderiales bacterium]
MDTVVRPIALADIEGFAACTAAVIAERAWLARVDAFPLEETARFVAHNIRTGNPQYVADAGGRIVGWCDVVRSSFAVHAHRGTLGMGLLAGYRGAGLGARLVAATVEAARGARFEQIDLAVFARNTRAIALYRRAGFRDVGIRRKGKKLDGEYDDVILMDLDLMAPR